jgi:hypothetical protein
VINSICLRARIYLLFRPFFVLGKARDRRRGKSSKLRLSEVLASLSLAKLYQSTERPLEAHAVLAPALEGSPTPEMPEIAEAQALMERLA